MRRFVIRTVIASWLALTVIGDAHAVKIMTSPGTTGAPSSPTELQRFKNIALAPNGTTIVATANFGGGIDDFDRIYSLEIPADPSTQTATINLLSTTDFFIDNPDFNTRYEPVISPDGTTVLTVHNGSTFFNTAGQRVQTIFTVPIAGEGSNPHTGLFDGQGTTIDNLAAPGNGNQSPQYSPDGNTIFFINKNAGYAPSPIPPAPSPIWDFQEWDLLYSVPKTGGNTVTAITTAADGDIDAGLFKVTPNGLNIVYAPDTPINTPTANGRARMTLFSVPTSGGASTQIPFPAPAHEFDIEKKLDLTPDGQNILFIADYASPGKNELWSVPIAGGTPTQISDDIPWDGDVKGFAISPDGLNVAYAAGQNTAGVTELFVTPIAGGSGNSKRVSEAPPTNSGEWDVGNWTDWRKDGGVSASAPYRAEDSLGQIIWNGNSELVFLGDFDVDDARDIHVVDTTEKLGLVPSRYTFVGGTSNEFFDESNWEDAQGNSPSTTALHGGINPAPTGDPTDPRMLQNLLIDGDAVVNTGSGGPAQIDFIQGASLEMTAGSTLTLTGVTSQGFFDTNPDTGFKMTDATLDASHTVAFEGTIILDGGSVTAGLDIVFDDEVDATIDGTTLTSGEEFGFDRSVTDITNATIVTGGTFGMRFDVQVIVNDTSIDVGNGLIDVQDRDGSTGVQYGKGSVLTLEGASTLKADAFDDGVSLVLDDTSVATLLHTSDELIDPDGTITFMSTGAELITMSASTVDASGLIINGFTGMSYFDDPSVWNITNWNGTDALVSLMLISTGLDGDFDQDGDVDGRDFLFWQRGTSPNLGSAGDLAVWEANYGTGVGPLTSNVTAVPEPNGIALLVAGLAALTTRRVRGERN